MILRVLLKAFSLIFMLTPCSAQVIKFGTCAKVETVKLFDLERVSYFYYYLKLQPKTTRTIPLGNPKMGIVENDEINPESEKRFLTRGYNINRSQLARIAAYFLFLFTT